MANEEDLLKEIERLKRVNEVLVKQILQKQEMNESFKIFQQNAALTAQIRERTIELERLTDNLKTEQNILEAMLLTLPGVIWFIKREPESMKFFNLGILHLSSWDELQNLETAQGRFGDVIQSTLKSMNTGVQMVSIDLAIKNNFYLQWLEVTVSSKDSNDIVIFVQDRSEIYRQREIIKQQELQIIQASRLASLGEMAAGVAHEINNPLAILSASAKILNKLANKDDLDRGLIFEIVEDINHTVKRIAQIVGAMRNLSRESRNFEKRSVKLQVILDEVISLCENRFKTSSVELRLKISPDLLEKYISCDQVQFSQVLVNLLNNSYDAVNGLRESWVEIGFIGNHETHSLTITDSGNGIPESVFKKIFDPFFTSKELGKGTGLGLSISKTIMEKHGGSIAVDRAHPHTRFVLTLPR